MIYFIYGDRTKAYQKGISVVDALLQKQPDANVLKFNAENYSDQKIDELLDGQGLFVLKNIVMISNVFSEIKSDFFEKNLKKIHLSDNIFILIDEEPSQKILDKIESLGIKAQNFSLKKTEEKKDNRIFQLVDLFGHRDKKNLWIKYQELLPEFGAGEILTVLWWQIKSIVSAKNSNSAVEAGLAPYVYTKSKSFGRNYSDQELANLIDSVFKIQSESYFDDETIAPKLEALFLNL